MKRAAQLARFALVAAVNLGVNLGVLAVGVHVLMLPRLFGRLGLVLAQAAAVFVATSFGYLLHARFTFTNARRAAGAGRFGRYWAVAGVALAVQVPLFSVLLALLDAVPVVSRPAVLPYAANVGVGLLVFVGSFLLNRIWTFQAR